MVNQPVWIGIVIGVFFVGIGISYAIFEANNPSKFMALTPQQMIQMMNDPQTQQMMNQMMQNPQFQQQMMEQMNIMMNDPELRQQMMTMMMQNPQMMQAMMGNQQMMGMMGQPVKQISVAPSTSIPENAKGPAIDFEKGYLVQEIKDGLYWLTDGSYQTMFLTTGEGVIAIDAPPSIGEKYLQAISEVTDEPVTHFIYSHNHGDHIGTASIFPSDATYIAHEETAAKLTSSTNQNVPIPTVTFSDDYTLEVGSQTLELSYKGPIHTPGNIFIYAPEQKVLMLVDVVFPGWSPFKNLALAEDVPAYLDAHNLILEYDFDSYIGGHVTRLGTSEDVETQKEYLQDIQDNVQLASQTVDFFAIAQQTGFENPWLLVDTYLDAISKTCADATIPDWVDRLGGVEEFTDDHCFSLYESQRID